MKKEKIFKCFLDTVGLILILTAVNMLFRIGLEGMWLFGIPKPEAVTSVTAKYQYKTEQIKEITDRDMIELCVQMSGHLKYRLLADPEVATGAESPRVTLYYHLADGEQVEISANATAVFYNGKKYLLKDDDTFINVARGLLFSEPADESAGTILRGTILEIEDGMMLIEPEKGSVQLEISDRFKVPVIHMPSSPEPKTGDVVEIVYDGIIFDTLPATLGEIKSIRVESVLTQAKDEDNR